jgi:hypothetical protein
MWLHVSQILLQHRCAMLDRVVLPGKHGTVQDNTIIHTPGRQPCACSRHGARSATCVQGSLRVMEVDGLGAAQLLDMSMYTTTADLPPDSNADLWSQECKWTGRPACSTIPRHPLPARCDTPVRSIMGLWCPPTTLPCMLCTHSVWPHALVYRVRFLRPLRTSMTYRAWSDPPSTTSAASQ